MNQNILEAIRSYKDLGASSYHYEIQSLYKKFQKNTKVQKFILLKAYPNFFQYIGSMIFKQKNFAIN